MTHTHLYPQGPSVIPLGYFSEVSDKDLNDLYIQSVHRVSTIEEQRSTPPLVSETHMLELSEAKTAMLLVMLEISRRETSLARDETRRIEIHWRSQTLKLENYNSEMRKAFTNKLESRLDLEVQLEETKRAWREQCDSLKKALEEKERKTRVLENEVRIGREQARLGEVQMHLRESHRLQTEQFAKLVKAQEELEAKRRP